jgi:hypothetical protein
VTKRCPSGLKDACHTRRTWPFQYGKAGPVAGEVPNARRTVPGGGEHALLDRLTHHFHILEMTGDSSAQTKQPATASVPSNRADGQLTSGLKSTGKKAPRQGPSSIHAMGDAFLLRPADAFSLRRSQWKRVRYGGISSSVMGFVIRSNSASACQSDSLASPCLTT